MMMVIEHGDDNDDNDDGDNDAGDGDDDCDADSHGDDSDEDGDDDDDDFDVDFECGDEGGDGADVNRAQSLPPFRLVDTDVFYLCADRKILHKEPL